MRQSRLPLVLAGVLVVGWYLERRRRDQARNVMRHSATGAIVARASRIVFANSLIDALKTAPPMSVRDLGVDRLARAPAGDVGRAGGDAERDAHARMFRESFWPFIDSVRQRRSLERAV